MYQIVINNLTGKPVRMRQFIKPLATVLAKHMPIRQGIELTVVLVLSRAMRQYNRRYHGQDRVTDVLTFDREIIMCPQYIAGQAKASGEPQWVWLVHALVHGIMHALGHHHESGGVAARRVIKLEEKILEDLGIKHTV